MNITMGDHMTVRVGSKAILAALLVITAGLTWPDGSYLRGVTIDGKSYGLVTFEPGLTTFKPIRHWLVSETYTAQLPVPEQYGRVSISIGRDSLGALAAVTLSLRRDSSVSMSRIPLVGSASGDTLKGHRELDLISGNAIPYPIEFLLVPSRHECLYRWSESPDLAETPGGVPTPLASALDPGKQFPRIKVSLLESGRKVPVVAKGRISVLNWWWTGCGPCIQEMPALNRLAAKYRGRVDFIAVTNDDQEDVRRFLTSRRFDYTQTLVDSVAAAVFGSAAPRNTVVNRRGVVVFDLRGAGPQTPALIEEAINTELAK
jgi:thiol-disulfide isomerase/thioredoxin